MNAATTCLLALWLAWVVAWQFAAPFTAPTRSAQSAVARLSHRVPIWFGWALLFIPARNLGLLHDPFVPYYDWIPWFGTATVAFGLGFAGWARVHLGRFWSGRVVLKADHALVRTGPYALTRHPIYTGLLLAFAGTAVARGDIAALAGLSLLVWGFSLKARQEERLLLGHFGEAYRVYQREVPALVPGLRRSSRHMTA